jgi:hypothetical protein
VPFCRIERAMKRVVFRTDDIMVLKDPGQPVSDIARPLASRQRKRGQRRKDAQGCLGA